MRASNPSDKAPRLTVRLDDDVKDWIRGEAKRNRSNQNVEINRRLRAAKDQETANAR